MAPRLPMAMAILVAVSQIEVAVADAGAVPNNRAMLVMMVVMRPWGMAVVTLVATMMTVSMSVTLGERGGRR